MSTPVFPYRKKEVTYPVAKLMTVLLIGLGVLFFSGIGKVGLFDVDEAIFAEASAEMMRSGDYITPSYNGEPRYHKPPLIYWMQSFVMSHLGVNAFAARLPSAIFALLTCFGFYLFVSAMTANRRYAFIATAILGLNLSFVTLSQAATADMALNFFVLMATFTFLANIYSRKRSNMPVFIGGVLIGLAFLAKGPIAVFVPAVVVGIAVIARGNIMYNLKCVNPFIALFAIALTLLPWTKLVIDAKGIDFFQEFWFVHNIGRYTEAMGNTHSSSYFYYIIVLLIGFFPWFFLLPSALKWISGSYLRMLRSDKPMEALPALGLLWFVAVVVFFSFSATKLPHYILPAYPGIALLLAARIEKIHEIPLSKLQALWILPIILIAGCFLIAFKWIPNGLIGLGPEVVLESFTALAQQFSFTWPLEGKVATILSQDVMISMAPVLMGAILITGVGLAFILLAYGYFNSIFVMILSMWVFLVLTVWGFVPVVYAYTQKPLADIAAKIIEEHDQQTDMLYFVALHQPSVRFISGVPFVAINSASLLRDVPPQAENIRLVLKENRVQNVLPYLTENPSIFCKGGFCLVTGGNINNPEYVDYLAYRAGLNHKE